MILGKNSYHLCYLPWLFNRLVSLIFTPKDSATEILPALWNSVLFCYRWQHRLQAFLAWKCSHLFIPRTYYLGTNGEALAGAWSCRSHHASAEPTPDWVFLSICNMSGPLGPSRVLLPGPAVSSPTVAPDPIPPWWERHFLTLAHRAHPWLHPFTPYDKVLQDNPQGVCGSSSLTQPDSLHPVYFAWRICTLQNHSRHCHITKVLAFLPNDTTQATHANI